MEHFLSGFKLITQYLFIFTSAKLQTAGEVAAVFIYGTLGLILICLVMLIAEYADFLMRGQE